MEEADVAMAAQDMTELLALPSLTPSQVTDFRQEEIVRAAARREVSKLAAEKEGRAQKDTALGELPASQAAAGVRSLAGRTTDREMVQHGERKALAEKAVMAALEKKRQVAEAGKQATRAKVLELKAAEAAAQAEALEVAATETAALERTVADAAPEVSKKMTRTELAAARLVAKTTAAAEKVQRIEEERMTKDAAYVKAMQHNNAGHLIDNPFSLPDTAPGWLTELIQYLPDETLGSEWRGCIQAFVTLHIDMGCADTVSPRSPLHNGLCLLEKQNVVLGGANRPAPIGKWIRSARQMEKPPSLAQNTYPTEWTKWWSGLQPAWRHGDGELPPPQYVCDEGDWGALRNCGKNGLGMVVLSLVWWGRALGTSPLWIAAAKDVARVMEGMVQGDGGSRKRVGEAASSGRVKRCVAFSHFDLDH